MWPISTPATTPQRANARGTLRQPRLTAGIALVGLSLGLALGLGGCGGKESPTTTSANRKQQIPAWEEYEGKIQKSLFELATASSPEEYAKAQGLEAFWVVRVVLVLASPDAELPEGFRVVVEERFGEEIQALVAVEDLLELARRPEIEYIRAPVKPKRYGP